MTAARLRLGRPEEIERVVAIDDDAAALYARAGLPITLASDDPFVRHERERWQLALQEGRVILALDAADTPVGFAVLGTVDGRPYLDQLSVRIAAMGRGLGSLLLQRAIADSAAGGELWLTTYGHLRFNRPFYERAGFRLVAERNCGPELREILRVQRAALPAPEQRVAMVRRA